MIDFTNIFGEQHEVFGLFFKAFAVVGTSMYIIYSIVIRRQTAVMLRALEEAHAPHIRLISLIQLILAVVLLVLALIFL